MFHPFFTSLLNSHIVVIYFTALPVFFTLSLHDALPIFGLVFDGDADRCFFIDETGATMSASAIGALVAEREIARRSEEHTSELQSRGHLVCRLLLEKKKKIKTLKNILL